MKKENKMAYPPKVYYPLDPSIKELLCATETKEEIDAYFEHIYHCIGQEICSECGRPVNLSRDDYRAEHIKEYTISGLCKECQELAFGV